MTTSLLSIQPHLFLSPFLDPTRPSSHPFPSLTYSFSKRKPLLLHRTSTGVGESHVARSGLNLNSFPDPEAAESLVWDLLGRAEGFLYTVADAAVSSSSDAATASKQSGDWLSGITNYLETVLKVLIFSILWFILVSSLFFKSGILRIKWSRYIYVFNTVCA